VPYDPAIHIGAKTEPDPFNKKLKWALMQMDWLVKKVYSTIYTVLCMAGVVVWADLLV
jgi:hypothetical protein